MMKLKDKIVCLVGASGSGKTTLAKRLEDEGYNIIHSHTTRPPRHANEWGHTFSTQEDLDKAIQENRTIALRNVYGKDSYWATKDQYQGKGISIYVVCPEGATQVRDAVKDAEIVVIFLDCSNETRAFRMEHRGDSILAIDERLNKDRKIFSTCARDFTVDANKCIYEVTKDVLKIIEDRV